MSGKIPARSVLMNHFDDSLDNPVDQVQNHRGFQRVLDLLDGWVAYRTKLHIGLFHEFYMVRFEGWIVDTKPGYLFQPANTEALNIIFFADAAKPFQIRDAGGRTSLTLGEISSTTSALVLTEDLDELVEFAMHLRPIA
jgi:hypothetical protein